MRKTNGVKKRLTNCDKINTNIMSVFNSTKEIERIVDCKLSTILNENGAVKSFAKCLDDILKDLNIEVHSQPGKMELAVRCNQDSYVGHLKMTSLWFYITRLEALGYIRFVETAAEKRDDIELGNSKGTQNGYLSKVVSDFISLNMTSNILVSPELLEYIKAGHISRELYEAKKSTKLAILSVLLAVISIVVSIVIPCCPCI